MKFLHNIVQKSPEWYALRLKYPLTASHAQAIGNQGKGLETLCWKKLSEKYSSAEVEQLTNKHLARGVELEPQAISLYELETGQEVTTVGFITNEEISALGGASPDGLVGVDEGGIEIKSFDDLKHFEMIAEKKTTGTFTVESGYLWQMQQEMLFADLKWIDFVAYNPNYKESLLIKRHFPDEVMREKLRVGLKIGEKLIESIENKLK